MFSSSAAVYGTPDVDLVTEETPKHPESPYGESKLIGEWLLADQGRRDRPAPHVACATSTSSARAPPDVYDASPHNLFPLVFDALLEGRTPRINGDDYPTPDGTCVRDYIHVADLAAAHVVAARAARRRASRSSPSTTSARGDGVSVGEIMSAVAAVTGIEFAPEIGPRRPGDPARIVASGELAARDLDWRMRHSLSQMVESAWEARRAAPDA